MEASKKIIKPLRLAAGAFLFAASVFFIIKTSGFYAMTPEALGKYFSIKWVLIGHIAGGAAALLTGPFLLWETVRKRSFVVHRYMGRVYVLSVIIAGLCAIYLSATTGMQVNWMYSFSLHVLASFWLIATWLAYRFAVKKKFKLHEEWVMRSYILTVAFVAQAMTMYHPYMATLGTFGETSPTVIWTSWTVPMFLYDIYLSSKKNGKR